MLQDEECAAREQALPDEFVDAVFAISCRCLPVDHAYALSHAIQEALPWFAEEPLAGLHGIDGDALRQGEAQRLAVGITPHGGDIVAELGGQLVDLHVHGAGEADYQHAAGDLHLGGKRLIE